ncbi:PREDICTED: 3-hydroxy-3-methylglutaryl-coenzyme A reductase-like [Erythranthe guttata]|uniref:3-hydroxy-3-methylglutaryl-coenzyme A reductase-like n=1 Tax=Erythranthe guttata TaxID=4155 RepID=UPI00064DDD30|nr:PREDICTED: 3-hydroxy-3-methylglutaryl-coenzyme A reductase-like [Erythranthe guttata]|eukprot:XP_012857523.1 PREDICTED: 3-hydroxy-3-methylglutaryl-coenzyme A reductase-like [Erythranthe guttata]
MKGASIGQRRLPKDSHSIKAFDALPLPLYLTNAVFFTLFFSVIYYLLLKWREKICNSTLLHLSPRLLRLMLKEDTRAVPYAAAAPQFDDSSEEDEEIVKSVVEGKTPSYALESKLGDCRCAPAIRRESLQHITGKSLTGLVVKGFNYEAILGQCCEMPVGYVQILVGIAGPLLLDGREYSVPMATTEGCLVASTIRGCKAIYAIIKEEIVKKVLKTDVASLVELNMLKNLTGSAMAGALGAVVTMGRLILGFFLSDGARRV